MPKRILHHHLPKEIILSYVHLDNVQETTDRDLQEATTGAKLIRQLAKKYLDESITDFISEKYEKPKAFINSQELSVSFSHTKLGLSAGISKTFNIGCDIELTSRSVSPSLLARMRCPLEGEKLYKKADPIQIWTLKEAALKMIGTGLRKPMNSVNISMLDESLFDVDFGDGIRAKICSFQHKSHWISICYHK
ncbi:MAG: 4'-phosphopantetheinyl transferase superfamily protein [Balneolaceae bacterium]|nr:4'-phosphopantetheinyl transferase superfamily protein [Balneolaceae bacterium]